MRTFKKRNDAKNYFIGELTDKLDYSLHCQSVAEFKQPVWRRSFQRRARLVPICEFPPSAWAGCYSKTLCFYSMVSYKWMKALVYRFHFSSNQFLIQFLDSFGFLFKVNALVSSYAQQHSNATGEGKGREEELRQRTDVSWTHASERDPKERKKNPIARAQHTPHSPVRICLRSKGLFIYLIWIEIVRVNVAWDSITNRWMA